MEIGEPQRTIIVEPLRTPVPTPEPVYVPVPVEQPVVVPMEVPA